MSISTVNIPVIASVCFYFMSRCMAKPFFSKLNRFLAVGFFIPIFFPPPVFWGGPLFFSKKKKAPFFLWI